MTCIGEVSHQDAAAASEHYWQAVDDEHVTRTHRFGYGRVSRARAARDLDHITFARHDVTIMINDLQWIEARDEPGRPHNMCPHTTRFDPDVVSAVDISPVEHADHAGKKRRFARPPTGCRQIDRAAGFAHFRRRYLAVVNLRASHPG